ncbi:uncharacterized protein CIMG_01833 [Coccidioides immitis RS]|uniref:Tyrosine specific protein phosphatases domain-containing protein n=3 Tax=Coccidioides immitis TaxID=5501 RepID=J3KK14_COCIM|nr:uncharacterized protein CIMG_01833 [Coccidioides immitis RS]EAS36479.3 hypothetical protein CIMG_01833 [Coccidioides immitis RS]KMP01840.1 hypothetical protein CIRG_01978 [Coccidioides immitis RMSCC 2394]KMU90251.1 hypothetical protein CIHG_08060 [Coccidioides immitis H538.4]TPX25401.1 hypothetical protein DIZ76_010856 [Coccidioides immitis]
MASVAQDTAALQDIETLVKTDVATVIAAEITSQIISRPPFLTIPGVFNVRDIGQPTGTPPVRTNFLFRSGLISSINDAGKIKLASELGVKKVFDLRSAGEREKLGVPQIEGVDIWWLPPAQDPRPVVFSEFGAEDGGLNAMLDMYKDILITHVPVFKEVFGHIKDEADKPVLFHCAAGKDRTGVLTALILRLAGCAPDIIARDYTLTRIGVEPARDIILKDLLSGMFTSDPAMQKGAAGLCSANYETMIRFLEDLEKNYQDGAEGYVKSVLGFSDDDVVKIKKNLTA